MKQQKSRLWK